MAVYMRCYLLGARTHMLSRSMRVSSIGNSSIYPLRNYLCCAKVYKQKNMGSDNVPDLHNVRPLSDPKTTEVHQIDQKLMDALYKQSKEIDSKGVSKIGNDRLPSNKNEYFKQAWQNKLDAMTHQEFALSEKVSSEEGEYVNNFGTLQRLNDTQDELSKKMDLRDPNERMAKDYPRDLDEERDWRKNIPLTRYGRLGRKAYYYTKKITKFGREGKVKEAIKVFDEWMMVEDRVMPSKRTFITLIGIVGRAGYTRKAFQLFRQMKHLGLDPPDYVYTSLFNACSNCPMPDYGLKHANALYQQMKVKDIPLSRITIMASMKAFAMCGDFSRAFQILDERRVPLDNQCFNTLLLACAVDKQTGFRRALKVWQLMRERNVAPTHSTYNLLVRCVRDCGVGDVRTLAEDLNLLSQGEGITPVDFFVKLEDGPAFLTSGKDLFQKRNETIIVEKGIPLGFEKERIETLSEIKPASLSTFPHMSHVSDESVPSFEDWPLPDKEINTLDTNVDNENIEYIISSAYSEEKLLPDELESATKSNEREWWESSDIDMKFGELNVKDNYDPLHSFPLSKESVDHINDKETGLTLFADQINSHDLNVKCVSLAELTTKSGRLDLIGGMTSLLSHMVHHGIHPDIRTFAEILSCVTNNPESEAMVLRMMELLNVAPDIDFLNDIMMRRNMRHESDTVKEVLVLMSKLRLVPNMRTYAAIALTCHRMRDALVLLDDMEAANIEPTIEIMGHMIYISRLDFHYKHFLLQKVEDMDLKPTHRIISIIEKNIAIAKRNIVKAEKMADIADSRYLTPKFQRQFKDFLKFYQSWLKRTELRHEKHPWDRYSENDTKKDETLQKAQKLS